MAKFLVLWRQNLLAPWPTDPAELLEFLEQLFEATERYVLIKEKTFFVDGVSGCLIVEGTSADVFKLSALLAPYVKYEVQEMLPYEMGKNTMLETLRKLAEAAKQK